MLVNLNSVLKDAQKNHYAVGLFNTTDSDMLEGVISAAEELRAPVIIGTAEVLLPYGELKLIAPSLLAAAQRATVPVVLHYDHGLTFDRCMEALKLGFSSIMFDGSAGDPVTNAAETRNMVRICHAMGVSVEGEIGHVGDATVGDNAATDRYTTPEEALDFLDKTGVDALAIAIGTAHGAYKIKPKLDFDRLKAVRASTDVPLVLHGGSGLSDDDFRQSVANGIAKVNIFTDLTVAGQEEVAKCVRENIPYLDMRNRKVAAIREAVKRKMLLFGCNGKA